LLSEDFASLTFGNNTSTSGLSTTWSGNSNLPNVVKAYQAGGAVKLGTGSANGSVTTKTFDLSAGGGAFTVSFKVKGWTTREGDLVVTATGLAPQTVVYSNVMADGFETKTVSFSGGTANSTVTIATTAKRAFLDDLVITTASLQQPSVNVSGNLSVLTSTYGSPSLTATSFTVSGANLTQGTLVDPPDGFEVSLAEDGVTGFAATQTIAGIGTIAPTTVFIRVAAGSPAGSHSGNIVCSSGAASATLAMPEAEVRRKGLNITASDQNKPFSQTLLLGSGQTAFTAVGLVGGEVVGSVTLAADGGTGANDAAGTYAIIPSAATGGTFALGNYDVNYLPGVLTVTGQSFGDWGAGLSDASPGADPDGNGLANLAEYFFGMPPGGDAAGVMVVGAPTATSFHMDYRRSKSLNGVTGGVAWRNDLTGGDWSTDGVIDTFVSDHGGYEMRRATVLLEQGESHKFLRVQIREE
jgi:hypothetical protein